jgi:hypothetical protein
VPCMNLLKKWVCYWWIIGRITSPVLWSDRSSHRGMSPRHNFCTTHNSDLSSLWCDRLWCSQTASKRWFAFRRRGSDHEIPYEMILPLQTDNGWFQDMKSLASTRTWVWNRK